MAEYTVWSTSNDGSLEYISLTKELLEPAVEAMQRSFYLNETICKAFNLDQHPEAFPDMDKLLIGAAKDGVSIVALDKDTRKVAGVAINKIVHHSGPVTSYETIRDTCKHPCSRNIIQWLLDVDDSFNIFNHCNVKTIMEIMFVGTVPEFRKRGIAKKLFEVSIEVARSLKQGKIVQVPFDATSSDLKKTPELVGSLLTSFITQKIARDLNFHVGIQLNFDRFLCDGKSLANLVDSKETEFITYEYLKI